MDEKPPRAGGVAGHDGRPDPVRAARAMLALPEADVRGVVAAGLPGYRVDAVVRLGQGLDHVAYEVNVS